jgi:hypothetical protein
MGYGNRLLLCCGVALCLVLAGCGGNNAKSGQGGGTVEAPSATTLDVHDAEAMFNWAVSTCRDLPWRELRSQYGIKSEHPARLDGIAALYPKASRSAVIEGCARGLRHRG